MSASTVVEDQSSMSFFGGSSDNANSVIICLQLSFKKKLADAIFYP